MRGFFPWQLRLLSVLIVGILFITGCRGCRESSDQFPETDQVPGTPSITLTDPANGDIGVAVNRKISVTFSDEMDPATISTSTIQLTGPGGAVIPGVVTYVGLTAVFDPTGNLANNTLYFATVTTGARNMGGSALAIDYNWNFTTGAVADNTAPTVTSTDPVRNAVGVPINKKITALFSEGMNAATILTTTFTVTNGGVPVAGTVTYVGLTANFTPAANLAPNTVYTVTITTGAKDLADNPLAANYTWTFTTGATADVTAPVVTAIDPARNAVGVATNKKITVTFSEGMEPATLKNTTFLVTGPGTNPVLGVVIYAGFAANFTPTANLANGTLYTVTITTGAKDLAGNSLAANYTWSFTTGFAPDTTAPTVTSTNPANGAVGVATNMKLAANFSETMNQATLNTTTFTVTRGGIPVPGSVICVGQIANFTPDSAFANNTLYTATITTGAKDLAGNALAVNKIWTFTTGAQADSTAPTVTSTSPVNGSTGVAINKVVTVLFSEELDPATMNTTTFTMTTGGVPVPGTVTYVDMIARFTPDGGFANNTLYTGTVTTGAKDLAGNALAVNKTWSFTTVAVVDGVAPTVTSTDPANNEVGVAVNKKLTATFNEAMTPNTISSLTFTLKRGVTAVPGTVSLTGLIAKFTPDANLLGNTVYTATITTGAKDLAGNALAVNKVWTFTTGAGPDIIAPLVNSTNPANNALDVAINQKIKATFSEAMDPDTITNLTFTVAGVPGAVTYDALTKVATFKSTADFAINRVYMATITTGAKDLAGNPLAVNKTWTFTTGVRKLAEPVALDNIAPFGSFGGGAGMTNQGTLTIVNGDIGTTGAATLITGFHDSTGPYTETPLNVGNVTGTIWTATTPPGSVPGETAGLGALDARTAYNNLSPAALPGGMNVSLYGGDPDQLGNRTLLPGIYQSAPGSFQITGGDLTLDAQNDPDAVWVFQMASTLTVGGPGFPRSVLLVNGAKAKNVFWQVGSNAVINAAGGGTVEGTIIAEAGVAFSTAGNVALTRLNGRAIGLNASVTLVNSIITIPAP